VLLSSRALQLTTFEGIPRQYMRHTAAVLVAIDLLNITAVYTQRALAEKTSKCVQHRICPARYILNLVFTYRCTMGFSFEVIYLAKI
jgi:hypothetical protein